MLSKTENRRELVIRRIPTTTTSDSSSLVLKSAIPLPTRASDSSFTDETRVYYTHCNSVFGKPPQAGEYDGRATLCPPVPSFSLSFALCEKLIRQIRMTQTRREN